MGGYIYALALIIYRSHDSSLSLYFNQNMYIWLFTFVHLVYLRAPPEVCYQRLRSRNRKEETGVPFVSWLHLLLLFLECTEQFPQRRFILKYVSNEKERLIL